MSSNPSDLPAPSPSPEPRWPAIIAALAAVGLYTALPAQLAVGPRWLQPLLIAALIVPAIVSHRRGNQTLNTVFGYLTTGAMTLFMLWSLVLLVLALPAHREKPALLLRSAVALWITNVLVFALWYWRIDAGGPHVRHKRSPDHPSAFLFPQMTLPDDSEDANTWFPNFVDYLFLAFNTSAAFSPTDTPVLSRWAKGLTMTQAAISLTVVAVLAARAVNIL